MGTLFNQQPRDKSLQSYVGCVVSTAETLFPGLTIQDIDLDQWQAAARVTEVALQIQSADTFDEQLAGLGEIAQDAVGALREIAAHGDKG